MNDCPEMTEKAVEVIDTGYDVFTTLDNYMIYFEPELAVIEIYGVTTQNLPVSDKNNY